MFQEQINKLEKDLEKSPQDLRILTALHALYQQAKRSDKLIDLLEKLRQLKEPEKNIYLSLAKEYMQLAKVDRALRVMEEGLKKYPSFEKLYSAYTHLLENSSKADYKKIAEEKRKWEERFLTPLYEEVKSHPNEKSPQRRLRIGYVSADFKQHSAFIAFSPLLFSYDSSAFTVYSYANLDKSEEDSISERVKKKSHWRSVASLSDAELCEQIRKDKIDILVDLSGQTLGHRLKVFAKRPAPLQLHAVGSAPLACSCIDYSLIAPSYLPEGAKELYPEKMLELPLYFGADLEHIQEKPGALPALSSDYFTFGCLNDISKLSFPVLKLWSEILKAVPHSRLFCKSPQLSYKYMQYHLFSSFAKLGISSERLILRGYTDHSEHLLSYGLVDLSLDPFPRPGGVSSLESCWMGVPVLSLEEKKNAKYHISHLISTPMGYGDWVCETKEEYLEKALFFSKSLSHLSVLRKSLREDLRKTFSPFVKYVEGAYREVWRRYCEGEAKESFSISKTKSVF